MHAVLRVSPVGMNSTITLCPSMDTPSLMRWTVQYSSCSVNRKTTYFLTNSNTQNLQRWKWFLTYCILGIFCGWNLRKFCDFGATRESFNIEIFIEYGGVVIHGLAIILDNSDSIGIMDHGCSLPFAGKAVFIQQPLPKPSRRHGSLNQQSPLKADGRERDMEGLINISY